MSNSPHNSPAFNIGSVGTLNTGNVTIHGDQVGIQHNHTTSPEIDAALKQLQTYLNSLQTQHPEPSSETEALAIIDAEFTEIQRQPDHRLATLRQQLTNPEGHFQATKATLAEIAKHYLEESVWSKAILTYIDKLSETPDQGE